MVWSLIIEEIYEGEGEGPHEWDGDKWHLKAQRILTMENIKTIWWWVMRRCEWDMEDPKKRKGGSQRHMIEHLGCVSFKLNKLNPTVASPSPLAMCIRFPISFHFLSQFPLSTTACSRSDSILHLLPFLFHIPQIKITKDDPNITS